jgi:hypothetical protein
MKALITILLVLPCFAYGQQCSVTGDCIGFSLDMQTVATEKDCLAHCKNTTNCQWYSFENKTLSCNALYNCQQVSNHTLKFDLMPTILYDIAM